MSKRYSTRGISKARVYKLKVAARILGVSLPTFRKWAKEGLNIIKDARPYLVRGADLLSFLTKREDEKRFTMAKGQFFCMRCDGPRDPDKTTLVFLPINAVTGRLSAVCSVCGGKVGRFASH